MRTPRALVAFLVTMLAAPALAGCFGEEPAPVTTFAATGSNAFLSEGWAYDGDGIAPVTGNLTIAVDAAADKGSLAASFSSGANESYEVLFETFEEAPNKTFQQGGIALDLAEHGASGNGDTAIPQLHARAAGWGTATVKRNGADFPEPISGGVWSAHFMATDTGIRNAEGKITKADKSATYDPASASDGYADPADSEVWLVLRTPADAPAKAPQNYSFGEAVNSPQYTNSFEFDLPAPGGNGSLAVTFGPASPAPVFEGSLTFTLTGPDGSQASYASGSVNPTSAASGSLGLGAPGKYKLDVAGSGVNLQWTAAGSVTFPNEVVLVVLFEDVQFS